MSDRHVVAVDVDASDHLTVSLTRAPVSILHARRPQPLGLDPDTMPAWTEQDAVKRHGSALFDGLKKAHAAIDQVLTTALQKGSRQAIYFHLLADEAEQLSWESLFETNAGFLALDRRWAIARIADTSAHIERPPATSLDSPLRVLAVLGAHNLNAERQARALVDQVAARQAADLAIELTLLIGEEPLYDKLATELEADRIPGITVRPMPARPSQVKAAIDEVRPHVLHFFAHGSVNYGVAALRLSHFGDAGQPEGSITLSIGELLGTEALSTVWLVSLNCCDTAKATSNFHSMAHQLVAEGVPAALGMREPITESDAHDVCEAFFKSVLEDIQAARAEAAENGGCVEIEWSKALHPTRDVLKDRHGAVSTERQWTLPVLYVRPETFYIEKRATLTAEDRRRVQFVAGLLRTLPPTTPLGYRAEILGQLHDIPTALRPDPFGAFLGNGS